MYRKRNNTRSKFRTRAPANNKSKTLTVEGKCEKVTNGGTRLFTRTSKRNGTRPSLTRMACPWRELFSTQIPENVIFTFVDGRRDAMRGPIRGRALGQWRWKDTLFSYAACAGHDVRGHAQKNDLALRVAAAGSTVIISNTTGRLFIIIHSYRNRTIASTRFQRQRRCHHHHHQPRDPLQWWCYRRYQRYNVIRAERTYYYCA